MRLRIFLFSIAAVAALSQPPGGGMQSGDGVWLRDAYFGERDTFDSCLAHQPGQGMYHNHVNPLCLRAQLGDNLEVAGSGRTGAAYREKSSGWGHSPILGWSLDGYPIYGPYGYSDPKNAGSAIKRMRSGFRLRNMTRRDSLPEWAVAYHAGVSQPLTTAQQGPPVNERFPLGRYIEDNEYVAGLGDLDIYNGRTAVTPEFPNGTYAYFITVKDDGTPAFPYIIGLQYYGTVARGPAGGAPTDAQEYFANGQLTGPRNDADALVASWKTGTPTAYARAVVGWDPAAGPSTTWPGTQPAGARAAMGGVTAPAAADIQRIRTTASAVYVNSNNLPSYVIGPWFAGGMNGGVFMNFAASIATLVTVPRTPAPASGAKTNTGLGSVGVWVNGVAIFNAADGASYRAASGDDAGGGIVVANAIHWSAASLEGGPLTPGALVTAFAQFEANLASATEAAATANWPTTLGGATVAITDASGVTVQAPISYASPKQVNYRIPEGVAPGIATVRITAGGVAVPGSIHILPVYPGLFRANLANAAVAQVARLAGGRVVYETVSGPVVIGPAEEQATLVLYGTGFNGAKDVTATVGGVAVPVAYAGPQGTYAGLDQINLPLPGSLTGKGKVDVVVTAGGKASNPVNVEVR